ncbi:hypothetical protein JW921_11345 [Candidatus Fermentibacterales bacterium]|nr:hypothetical protein [Candidatus Fermentibacterales bacterium]
MSPAPDRRPALAALALFVLLSSSAIAGWTVVPLAGYSSTTGFAYGAMVAGTGVLGLDAASLQAYRTTRGREVVELGVVEAISGGVGTLEAEHYRTPTARFFGYGNGGSDDEYVEYSEECNRLRMRYFRTLFGPVDGGLGAEVRHSVVYDREQGDLWETLPGQSFSSAWSAGPSGSLVLRDPAGTGFPGYVRLDGSYQWSEHEAYGRLTARLAQLAPLAGPRTVLGAHVGVTSQSGIETSPFTWRPTLGGADDLRAFRDWRFTGRWLVWSNLELRQHILTVSEDPEAYVQRLGLVLFGDAGQVSDEPGGLAWNRFHLCAGIGLRIHMAENVTVRADFSRGPEGNGIVLTFGEMF